MSEFFYIFIVLTASLGLIGVMIFLPDQSITYRKTTSTEVKKTTISRPQPPPEEGIKNVIGNVQGDKTIDKATFRRLKPRKNLVLKTPDRLIPQHRPQVRGEKSYQLPATVTSTKPPVSDIADKSVINLTPEPALPGQTDKSVIERISKPLAVLPPAGQMIPIAYSNSSPSPTPVSEPTVVTIPPLFIDYTKTTTNSITLFWSTPTEPLQLRWLELAGGLTNPPLPADPPYPARDLTSCPSRDDPSWAQAQTVTVASSPYTVTALSPDRRVCFYLTHVQAALPSGIVTTRTLSYLLPPVGYPITFSGVLNQSAVFTREYSPYSLNRDWVIPAGVTAAFEPGVVVKAALYTKITIQGMLASLGSLEQPVVFTSEFDDTRHGDSNADANATTSQPGDWEGIQLESSGSLSNPAAFLILYGP